MLPARFGTMPWDTAAMMPYRGTRSELMEVMALAQTGRIDPHTEPFALEEAGEVYQRPREGKSTGRAVSLPHG